MMKGNDMKFDKDLFQYDGMYLKYNGRFVARFKRGGMASFKSFLVKNFTVEEYFDLYDRSLSPIDILETKGYVSPQVARILKSRGYPMTLAGRDQMIRDDIARRAA